MADAFFSGGQLPKTFNHASGALPNSPPNSPKDPELTYDPPEFVPPGLGAGAVPQIDQIAREELGEAGRDAIQQARDRMERGETEHGDAIISDAFNQESWSSQDIEDVRQEDQQRGQSDQMDWDEQTQREYERWSLESAQERYNGRWGNQEQETDHETIRNQYSIEPSADDTHRSYDDFMRDQNAELDVNQDYSLDLGEHKDPDMGIDH